MGRTGAYGRLIYGWESTYKDGASTKDKTFGMSAKVSSLTHNENLGELGALGSRETQSFYWKGIEGALSVDFILANPFWMKGLFGAVADGGSAPYTHTFTQATAPVTMGVEVGFQGSSENVVRTLKGVVIDNATISAQVGEPVSVKLDMKYADISIGTSLTDNVTETFDIYTFAHGGFYLPDSTLLAEVQNVELSMGNESGLLFGLGDYVATKSYNKKWRINGRFTVATTKTDFIDYVVARSEVATAKLVFTNGLTGSDERTITYSLTGVGFGEHNTAIDINELVTEELPFSARQITAVAEDNTSATP